MGEQINDYPEQTILNNTDDFILQVTSGGATKRTLWSTIKSTLKTYFDNIYYSNTSATKTGSYTILDSDGNFFILSGASGNSVFTLPTLADNIDKEITLFNYDSTYELNINGEGAETIEGLTDIDAPKKGNYLKVKGFSSGWIIIEESITCQLEFNTYAGYGSTDLNIPQWTNKAVDIGNIIGENHTGGYNGGIEGLEFTVLRNGWYSFNFSISTSGTVNAENAITRNSTQLTIAPTSLTVSTRLQLGLSNSFFSILPMSATVYLEAGDVIRGHTNAEIPSAADRCNCIATYLGQ